MTVNIAVSPLGRQSESTEEVVNLNIYVSTEDYFGVYDRLEVWRSRTTIDGPYEELTAPETSRARLPKNALDEPESPITGPFVTISGKELELLINGEDTLTVVFTGVDPLSYSEIASQIIAQCSGFVHAYVSSTPQVVLESTSIGTGASLQVVGGDAAPLLNLPTVEPESLAYGKEARLFLSDELLYKFTDLRGSASYFYKVRFRNSNNDAVSEFSLPHNVASKLGVDPSNIIIGKLDLVMTNGKPLINRSIRLRTEFSGSIVDGKLVAGSDVEKKTDENGHVEFTLIRGQKLTVAISGTNLVRTITVPTNPTITEFNLFDPSIDGEDVFKVQVPTRVFAPREAL